MALQPGLDPIQYSAASLYALQNTTNSFSNNNNNNNSTNHSYDTTIVSVTAQT
jgi:hypothetical protein